MSGPTEKEINATLARYEAPADLVFDPDGHPMTHNALINEYRDLNYCNNWNLLMPLAIKLHIGFDPLPTDETAPAVAWSNVAAIQVTADTHQRAIAECAYRIVKYIELGKGSEKAFEFECDLLEPSLANTPDMRLMVTMRGVEVGLQSILTPSHLINCSLKEEVERFNRIYHTDFVPDEMLEQYFKIKAHQQLSNQLKQMP